MCLVILINPQGFHRLVFHIISSRLLVHIREERKPFWVSSADFISTSFPLLLLLILWLRKNKNTKKKPPVCRRRRRLSSAFYNISSSGFIFVGSVGRVIVCFIFLTGKTERRKFTRNYKTRRRVSDDEWPCGDHG